jgi:hypothetical protein
VRYYTHSKELDEEFGGAGQPRKLAKATRGQRNLDRQTKVEGMRLPRTPMPCRARVMSDRKPKKRVGKERSDFNT